MRQKIIRQLKLYSDVKNISIPDFNQENVYEENTYYFGINDDYMKNIQAKEITIKNKLLLDSNKEVIDENNHYLCAWGMII